ncbi:MAG: Ketose-bisphosphate aldolase, class-II [Parcubacteria group bacterium Athens0714_16]|nr:MAG: Ketose-bisphosphate aldolase, class-II [Parcubacteria group bacterium Athens0714_16]
METLKKTIENAEKTGVAVGHFNISNIEGLHAVFNVAKKLNLPVIIGVSEGERDFIGIKQVVALVKSLREEHNYPIFLNADHTYSFERVKEVVDAGFDSVIFDGAKLSTEENIKITKQCVEYVKKTNPKILVEAELGFIGSSSKILDEIPEDVNLDENSLTKPTDAKYFVKKTGIDLFAPAVGNIHGMLGVGKDPSLNIELIKEIRKEAGVPLVLHGGSGTTDEDFKKAIKAGISIIHINTEIRLAYKKAIQLFLQENPDEIAPYKIMKSVVLAMEKVVEERMKLFNFLNADSGR